MWLFIVFVIIETDASRNKCKSRVVDVKELWNLNSVCPNVPNGIEYIEYGRFFDPGFDIYIMDTGIDPAHEEFKNIKIERIYDPFKGIDALHKHGTHVAAILIGKKYGVFKIPNKKIKIYDVRAFGDYGSKKGKTHALEALDTIIEYLKKAQKKSKKKTRKAIINISMGIGFNKDINEKIAEIKSLNGICIVAAGNQGIDASKRSPASSDDAITVGNIDKGNKRWNGRIHDGFGKAQKPSNFGSKVDIWAPGFDILSAALTDAKYQEFDTTHKSTGTSQATPLVAGVAANILANNPQLTFEEIKKRLLEFSVKDVNDRLGQTNLPRVQISCDEYCGLEGSRCEKQLTKEEKKKLKDEEKRKRKLDAMKKREKKAKDKKVKKDAKKKQRDIENAKKRQKRAEKHELKKKKYKSKTKSAMEEFYNEYDNENIYTENEHGVSSELLLLIALFVFEMVICCTCFVIGSSIGYIKAMKTY